MSCNGFLAEDYGLYALGNLDGAERAEIAGHLVNQCPVCTVELAKYRVLWSAVGLSTPESKPSRALRNRLIQSVGGRMAWWSMPLPLFAGAAAMALIVGGSWLVVDRNKPLPAIAYSPVYRVEIPAPNSTPAPERIVETVVKQVPVEKVVEKAVDNPAQAAAIAALNQDLIRERQRGAELSASLTSAQRALADAKVSEDAQRRVASLTARTQELERQVAQYRVLLETERKRGDQTLLLASMVSDPSLRVVQLRATEKSQTVEGHALIAGNSQMLFYASKLPALPSNRVYQLWLIRSNGQAIASAGIFSPDSASRGALQLKNPALLQGVTTIALTDEPAGGSMQPTGHKWLIGS